MKSIKSSFSAILIISMVLITIFIYFPRSPKLVTITEQIQRNEGRGVIVTMIRSSNESMFLVINMIHSILHFYPYNGSFPYSLIIFHDENFKSVMREQILSCVLQNKKQIQISFSLVNFTTSVKPASTSRLEKPIGYRLMCRFWIYDLFYHPAILQGKYDYLMRMDDDSYFSDSFPVDPISYIQNKKLDYIYRSIYSEPIKPLKALLGRLMKSTIRATNCIYNNFFVMRLEWFYKSKEIQKLIHELVKDDLILREYIGDGCVHAAMLRLDKQTKSERIKNIPYGHNFHLMPFNSLQWNFEFRAGFLEEMNKSCKQLTVLQSNRGILARINISAKA